MAWIWERNGSAGASAFVIEMGAVAIQEND